jgi:hypothetical protein
MTTIGADYVDTTSTDTENWLPGHLADNIFVNLMEIGVDSETNSNKYIIQFADKFEYLRIRSPSTFFEIDTRDLDPETIILIDNYTKDCKTIEDRYSKLDEIIVEAVARIGKQAEPKILSSRTNGDNMALLKVALNEIREMVSFRWRLISGIKGRCVK